MGIQVNFLVGIMYVLALWHQDMSARNSSFVLFRKLSVKELSEKIIGASRAEVLIRSNQWRAVASWWHELVRVLTPEIRLRLYHYIDAGNKICFDVSWIREHCLCEAAVSHAARVYRDHKVKDIHGECAYAYRSAQLNCLQHSMLVMALCGTHKEIARGYFDYPVVHDVEQSRDDTLYVQQAYHALWKSVSRELEVIYSMCCEA
jgi:hypothetical protein